MKLVLTLAAASAMTLTAATADAQSRRRAPARAAAAQPAPLPPTPYRLVGPGAETATAVQPAPPAAPAQPAAAPSAPAGETAEDAEDDAGPATPERARAETALRRVLGELAAGTPDYAQMNEATAARVRTQQPSLTPALKQYGAIRTLTPLAATGGSQRFRVDFANGSATFVIATDAAGKITALGVES